MLGSHPRTWRDASINTFMGRTRGLGKVQEATGGVPASRGMGQGVLRDGSGGPGKRPLGLGQEGVGAETSPLSFLTKEGECRDGSPSTLIPHPQGQGSSMELAGQVSG